jgi:hypothetical protein
MLPALAFGQKTAPPPYEQLRYEEDYQYLRDPARRMDAWDALKYIPLDREGHNYLSIGGEARERYEWYHNANWGQGPQDDDGYLLQRYMLHADWHPGTRVRLFFQLKSGLEDGRTGGPRPTDEDRLDVHQGFFDWIAAADKERSLTLRIGRQEMSYGSSRLVSVRESPNVRQSFDGVRMIWRAGRSRIDGFVTRPVETNPGEFDDSPDRARAFWGLYAVSPARWLPGGNIDLYYLGLDRQEAQFDQGSGHEVRHSVGTRLWGHVADWDYNTELVYQWGRFGNGDISAWTAGNDFGYTLRAARYRPRFGLRADIISGDQNPASQDLQTFNPLFPKGAYFGQVALIGPANLMDLHPSIELHPSGRVTVTTDLDLFWRYSLHDGIYGNALNLLRTGQQSRARFIGSQISAQAEWNLDRHTTFVVSYAHFFAGSFLKETPPGQDVDYFTAWVTYRF